MDTEEPEKLSEELNEQNGKEAGGHTKQRALNELGNQVIRIRTRDHNANLSHDCGEENGGNAGDHGHESVVDRRGHRVGKLDRELGLDQLDVDHGADQSEDQGGKKTRSAGERRGDHARSGDIHRDGSGVSHGKTGETGGLEALNSLRGDTCQGIGELGGEVHRGDNGGQGDRRTGNGRNLVGLAQVITEREGEA